MNIKYTKKIKMKSGSKEIIIIKPDKKVNRLKQINNPTNMILKNLLIRFIQKIPLSFSRLISSSLR